MAKKKLTGFGVGWRDEQDGYAETEELEKLSRQDALVLGRIVTDRNDGDGAVSSFQRGNSSRPGHFTMTNDTREQTVGSGVTFNEINLRTVIVKAPMELGSVQKLQGCE